MTTPLNLTLQVGTTTIPYRVRYSTRAQKKRVVVTAEGVEVVAPEGTPLEGKHGILTFVDHKRRWIFDAQREVTERRQKILGQRWASGNKLQYRGRWLMLDIRPCDVDEVQIACRSRFHIRTPTRLEGLDQLEAVRGAVEGWLQERAEQDLVRFARRHERNLDVKAKTVHVCDHRHAWGLCSPNGVIRTHWRLIQAPVAAFEYVVAHEVVHLLHRNHSDVFWATLASTLPEWPEGKRLLEQWEGEHRAV